MASYNGYTNTSMIAVAKTSGPQTVISQSPSIATPNSPDQRSGVSSVLGIAGTKVSKHTARTPSSSVYITDVMQINGPRQFPLEISWKKAETGN